MRYIVDPPKSPLKRGTLIYFLYFMTARSAVYGALRFANAPYWLNNYASI